MGKKAIKQGHMDDNCRSGCDEIPTLSASHRLHTSATSVTDGIFPNSTCEANNEKSHSIPCGGDNSEEALEPFMVLPSLSNYSLGDPLRKPDMAICCCKEATAYAMGKLRLGDCAFVLRSNGSYTYAHYEGYARGDLSSFSFKVDDRGHYKPIRMRNVTSFVKIPVLMHHAAAGTGDRSDKVTPLPSESPLVNLSRTSCTTSRRQSMSRASSSVNSTGNFAHCTRRPPRSHYLHHITSLSHREFETAEALLNHEVANQKEENHMLHKALSYISLKLKETDEGS